MSKRDLSNIKPYQLDVLKQIESSLAFQNQQLQGKIMDKSMGFSFYGGTRYVNNYRWKKIEQVAHQIGQTLGIAQYVIQEALLLFKLVQSKNWI